MSKAVIPGTEHIIASRDRAQELLDFIEREPVMRMFVERARKVGDVTDDACMGDCHSEACLILATAPYESKELADTDMGGLYIAAGLQWCELYSREPGWYITGDGQHYPESTFIGEKLDSRSMQKIVQVLKVNAHDQAEAVRIYGRKPAEMKRPA